jgi:hypothetical protein
MRTKKAIDDLHDAQSVVHFKGSFPLFGPRFRLFSNHRLASFKACAALLLLLAQTSCFDSSAPAASKVVGTYFV